MIKSISNKAISILKKPMRNWVLSKIGKEAVCAEIGVWKGDYSSQIILRQPKELHLIDPWKQNTDVPDRYYAIPQEEMDEIYNGVKQRFKEYNNVFIHRGSSEEAASKFPDSYFDWIYIDANHCYEYVKQDLEIWSRKIKKGGYLCGDDYRKSKKYEFGVVQAVNEFAEEKKLKIHKFGDQFCIPF